MVFQWYIIPPPNAIITVDLKQIIDHKRNSLVDKYKGAYTEENAKKADEEVKVFMDKLQDRFDEMGKTASCCSRTWCWAGIPWMLPTIDILRRWEFRKQRRKNGKMKRNNAIIVLSICVMFLAGAQRRRKKRPGSAARTRVVLLQVHTSSPEGAAPARKKHPGKTGANSKPAHQRIKETGEMILGNAMVNPTEENVRAYMEYQKKMLDDANRFSQVWERVLAKYPTCTCLSMPPNRLPRI